MLETYRENTEVTGVPNLWVRGAGLVATHRKQREWKRRNFKYMIEREKL